MKTITFFCSVFSRMSGQTKDEERKEAIAVVQAGCFHCTYLERRYTYALFFASLQQGRQSKKPQLRSPTLLLPPFLGVCHTSFLLLSSLSLFFSFTVSFLLLFIPLLFVPERLKRKAYLLLLYQHCYSFMPPTITTSTTTVYSAFCPFFSAQHDPTPDATP